MAILIHTLTIRGQEYAAVSAAELESGMIYHDGYTITNVRPHGSQFVRFELIGDGISVERIVKRTSLIAIAN